MLFWESLGLSHRMRREGYGSSDEEDSDDSSETSRTDASLYSKSDYPGSHCLLACEQMLMGAQKDIYTIYQTELKSHCLLACEQMLMDAHKDINTIYQTKLETTGSRASSAPEVSTTEPLLQLPSKLTKEASIIIDEPLERELSLQPSRKIISVQIPVILPGSSSKPRNQGSRYSKKTGGPRGGARSLAEMFSGFKKNIQRKRKLKGGGSRFSSGKSVPRSARTLCIEKSYDEAREDDTGLDYRGKDTSETTQQREMVVMGMSDGSNGYEIVTAQTNNHRSQISFL